MCDETYLFKMQMLFCIVFYYTTRYIKLQMEMHFEGYTKNNEISYFPKKNIDKIVVL